MNPTKYPVYLFSRTPYNFNYWDIELGAPRDMSAALDAVKHGYAFVEMNERGRYFSEGDYDILGVPLTDSDDEFDWMTALPLVHRQGRPHRLLLHRRVAAGNVPPAATRPLPTIIPESFGAGVGRVGPYYEQGNWFRGGPFQRLRLFFQLIWAAWPS